MRRRITDSKRWVVKIGSSLLTDPSNGLNRPLINHLCQEISNLVKDNVEVVLVSSGSIAEGMARLDWQTRPREIHQLQAAAAVGQMGLVQAYESAFKQYQLGTAQVLLTHEDLANRRRYLNARATLRTLLKYQMIPVVNENDTVTTDEIRFGDNDTLGALVATLVEADLLILLTDQPGLFSKDPRKHSDAVMLERADAFDPQLKSVAGPSGSSVGSGGMLTKILAAERAALAGTTTIIAAGDQPEVLTQIRSGASVGTMLTSDRQISAARKQWLGQLRLKGQLVLDDGACERVRERGASLLGVGVTRVNGEFQRGELVSCVDQDQQELARGLSNYSSVEAAKLCGVPSEQIQDVLGFVLEPELIHRDNLILS